jgi:hypothetical protein
VVEFETMGTAKRPGLFCAASGTPGRVQVGAEDLLERTVDGFEESAGREDDGDEKQKRDGGGDDGVVGREPGEADGYRVFGGAEGDIGDGLGRRGDGGANRGLGGVGGEGDGSAERGGEYLHLRGELGAGLVGDKRGDRDADEGVEDIPEEIEGGELVGEELDEEEDGRDDEDPGVGEGTKTWRKLNEVGAVENAECEDGGVDVESGCEAGGDDQRGDAGWGEHLRRILLRGLE